MSAERACVFRAKESTNYRARETEQERKRERQNKMLHFSHFKMATHHLRTSSCTNCCMQVFLILTLFVIGNLSAWQENVRPKLYVELGKLDKCFTIFICIYYDEMLVIRTYWMVC